MRSKVVALIAAAAGTGLLLATIPVDAQDRARTRITVQKRSYLDAGTVIKPGDGKYHDYAFPVESRYPSYGPFAAGTGSYGASRWPLLGKFEGF